MTRAGLAALLVASTMSVSPAAGAAPSWGPPTTLGTTARDNGSPDIAVAPDGEAIATWLGTRPEGIRVSTRRPGKGWSPPVNIASIGEEVQGPRIAVSAGKAVVVWSDNIRTRSGEDRVILAATRLRGKRWSRPRNISADRRWRVEPRGEEPQIVMTRRGRAIVVWIAGNEGHSTVSFVGSATQTAGETDWSAPVGIRGSYEAEEVQVAARPVGEAVAIWGSYYNEESNISVASRPAEGPWEGARQLSTPGAFPQPQVAITSKGEAIGTWVKEAVEGADTVVQVATRPSGGKWKVWAVDPGGFGTGPRIVTEPGGRATLFWVKGGFFEDATVVASTHAPGGVWSEPTNVAAEGLQIPSVSESPIAVTRDGESIALWATDRPAGGTTIHSTSRRRPQPWTEPTEVFTCPPGSQYGGPDLQLALAPDGKAFAIWRCFNGSRWVIKAATRPAAGSEP